jgi:hypothetical protein
MFEALEGNMFRVNLPYACGGVIVKEDQVVQTAPIFNWMVGKSIGFITRWVNAKGGEIELL